ncbi:LanC-like protein 2 [Rhynchospora pubera]|uniref:LanC-like protein 2 n=1 Tax=Rhynchospora pubera TaxID=906938 RepID=A0AAV8E7L4_9POAL|nr:LanC-like protein 2 [Rhynchospora pubera]
MSKELEESHLYRPSKKRKKGRGTMADRFFPNEMPDFVEETEGAAATGSSLARLLSLPYPKLSEKLLKAGLDLKEKIVKETWIRTGQRVTDYTLYTGALGTAFLLFKSYQVTKNQRDLSLCAEIIKACDTASKGLPNRFVTFICGRAGVCALGAVVSVHLQDKDMANHYLTSFNEITMPSTVPNELLYGRAGYLWACSFLNKHIGKDTICPDKMGPLVKEIIRDGRRLSNKSRSPLMYEWHGKKYWGAAHGLTGIMHVLMEMELKQDEKENVKGTLNYMIQNRFPGGNYPSSEGSTDDRLVHWCHGAPGVSLTMAKAYEIFKEDRFLHAASNAAEVVWNRGLLKRVGICHGISGNAYTFLSLYRQTGNKEYLYRAKAFTCFLLDRGIELIADGVLHSGDRPFSLFEGQAGMAYLFLDMANPAESGFPGYEL